MLDTLEVKTIEQTEQTEEVTTENQLYPVDDSEHALEFPLIVGSSRILMRLQLKPITKQIYCDYQAKVVREVVSLGANAGDEIKTDSSAALAWLFDQLYKGGSATNLSTGKERVFSLEDLRDLPDERKEVAADLFLRAEAEVINAAEDDLDLLFSNDEEIRVKLDFAGFSPVIVFNKPTKESRRSLRANYTKRIQRRDGKRTKIVVEDKPELAINFFARHFNRAENCTVQGEAYREEHRERFLQSFMPHLKIKAVDTVLEFFDSQLGN